MKNFVLAFALLSFLFSFKPYTDDNDLCLVNNRNGKLVFWNCDPLEEYDVVFSFKGTANNVTQAQQSANMVKEAIVQAHTDQKEFDAIIVGNTERDEAIKFKQTSTKSKKSLNTGRARRINGIPVFIDCTPVEKYEHIKKIKKYRGRNQWNGGLVYFSSIKLATIITEKGSKGDALIIGDDQFHHWIKFK